MSAFLLHYLQHDPRIVRIRSNADYWVATLLDPRPSFGRPQETRSLTHSQRLERMAQESLQVNIDAMTVELDPCSFWASNLEKWPELATHTLEILSCPAASVLSERVFSVAGGVLTDKRTRLSSDNVDRLTFIKMNKSWIRKDFSTPVDYRVFSHCGKSFGPRHKKSSRVWDVKSGEVLNTLIHHNEAVLHLRFCNGLMVTCSKDRSIAVWDMASPTDITLRRVLVGHRAAVNVVDFDDKYIVSASGDRTIKVWSTSTCEFVRTLNGHKRGIACLQYRDRLVVSGSSDNTIRSFLTPSLRFDVSLHHGLKGVPQNYVNERPGVELIFITLMSGITAQYRKENRKRDAGTDMQRQETAALYGAYFNMEHLMEAIINLCAEL
ncbi:unnamed protein product [Ranitomeya imitator]|uniref:HAT C-terminal dimerisation domain-containing protein n=1 Tax=Ranitomeya imitator TaxID=111125 RepID=A0ABN9LIL8_9NEOB|nr:unnamed protein product [Ranitomeya imitator]